MSVQSDYSPESWDLVVSGPFAAGYLVIVSDPSILGSVKESLAIAKTVNAAATSSTSELLTAINATMVEEKKPKAMPDLPKDKGVEGALQTLLDHCRKAADAVTETTPDEADAYKAFMVTVAENTAQASKEGGFLGIGAVRVSDAEKAIVDRLSAALGVTSDD